MNYKIINSVMSGLVVIICLLWLYMLWFTDAMYIERTQKIILTSILTIYMLFRAWRLYSSLKK
ncbi:MAG: hypothetical protein V4638_00150 [Bacteroidota bacterium]